MFQDREKSILKVLHGNTKSPTGCMYSWRYNILYLTIIYNIRNVSVFVCTVIDLHAKNQQNICKGIEKTVSSLKFTKSARSVKHGD